MSKRTPWFSGNTPNELDIAIDAAMEPAMSERTPWYPASVNPVREGWYEWQCASVLGGMTALAHWARVDWDQATVPSTFTPASECRSCRWRGLTRPAEE